MNGRLPQSLLLAVLGVTLAPATLRAGTGPCGGAGERACCCSGDGRSCLTQDGCDSDLIEVFVPPCGMTRTPSCGGCSVSWCAKETSCGHDGERACCDIPSCNGSLIEDFTREGKCTGKLGPENCVCGAGAFLSAGICREKKNAGEMCNVFTPCADNLNCQFLSSVESRCYPEFVETGFEDSVCAALYNIEIHNEAMRTGTTLTFGTGTATTFPLYGVSKESGVVYGRDGSYGCYQSECEGFEVDVAWEVNVSEGRFDLDFDDIAGQDCSICAGGGFPFIEIGAVECITYVGDSCNPCISVKDPPDLGGIDCPKVGNVTEFSAGFGINPVSTSLSGCTTTTTKVMCMNAEGEIVRITPEVECNARPFCDAGGDTIAPGAEGPVEIYDAGCAGEPFELLLDGTGSRDPDGSPLTYQWYQFCPGTILTGGNTATPTLTTAIGITTPCTVGLVVFDGVHESECTAQIRVGVPPGSANIVLDAADEQVECDDADNAPELSAWLNSQGGAIALTSDIVPLDWTNDFSPPLLPTAGGCGGEKSVDVTFKANVCNPDNSDETTATFATIDTTRPAFEDCPGNVIISCTDSISPTSTGTATANDTCSPEVTVTFSDVGTPDCASGGTITRTWKAVDICDQSSSDKRCRTDGKECNVRADCSKFCSGGLADGIPCAVNSECVPQDKCEISHLLCTGPDECPAGLCSGGSLNGTECLATNPFSACKNNGGTCIREACVTPPSGTCVRDFCELPVITKCARAGTLCDPADGCSSRCTGGQNDGNRCETSTDCAELVCVTAGISCGNSFDCPGECDGGLNDGQPCDLHEGASECPLGFCDVVDSCVFAVIGACDADTCEVIQTQCVQTITVLAACPTSSAPVAETLAGAVQGAAATGLPVNTKNRFVSIMTTDAGRTQAIRVRFVDLPSPFDVWNEMDFFAGAPREVCENSGQDLDVSAVDCSIFAGPTRTFWIAPLVCDKEVAHFMDWHGRCDGGSCAGGLKEGQGCNVDDECAEVVHFYHEGLIPGGIYDIQVVDSSCSLQDESTYSSPLTMIQSRWGDMCGPSGAGACTGVADGIADVANDVLGVLDKFENINDLQKARADIAPGIVDFIVDVASDVLLALEAFTGAPYPFTPGDPCNPG